GSDIWDAVPIRGRVLLVSYMREDRTFRAVTLRLKCCPECGQPPPPERITFTDPGLLLGRSVTGLAACASGDRLLVALTRETLVQAAGVSSISFLPEPGARLLSVAPEPLWRRLAAMEFPVLTFFGAVALLCLGVSMFRERNRVLSVAPAIPPAPPYADLLDRAMAQALDVFLVGPQIGFVLSEVMSTTWEGTELFDQRFFTLLGTVILAKAVYHVLMESTLGWSIGKRILGLKVVRTDGARADLWGVLIRSLFRLVEVEAAQWLLGSLVMVNTPRRQRLGDLLGGTVVLRDRPSPAP
ncbi:MAG TPA: RDD family protein, partial [Planctomycetota bacterium]|nr:RDD family protein [Planctomycetota bacterium]